MGAPSLFFGGKSNTREKFQNLTLHSHDKRPKAQSAEDITTRHVWAAKPKT